MLLGEMSVSPCHFLCSTIHVVLDRCCVNTLLCQQANASVTVVKKVTSFLRTKLPIGHGPNSLKNPEMIENEILPDIIFHDRMSPANNFLVIEIKKSTNKNKDDHDYDIAKLEKLTTFDLAYTFGAFIEISTGFHLASKLSFLIRFIEKGTWV